MAYLSTYRPFPFCIADANPENVGPGSIYPIALTFEEMFYIYYRVKKWKIDFSYKVYGDDQTVSGTFFAVPGTYIVTPEGDGDATVESEAHLACPHVVSGALVDELGNTLGDFTMVPERKIGNDYYPYIFAYILPATSANTYSEAEVGALTILGREVSMYSDYLSEMSATMTPIAFWPYDPGDTADYPGKDGSGLVYGSATGAQLRNPFNIVKRGDGTFYNPDA